MLQQTSSARLRISAEILQRRQTVCGRAGAAEHQLLLSQPALIAVGMSAAGCEGVVFYLL